MMERRVLRSSATFDENSRNGREELNVSRGMKRTTLGEATNQVTKGGLRPRGLTVRQNGTGNIVDAAGPPAKKRIETKESEEDEEVEVKEVVRRRPKTSEECDLLTDDFVNDIKNYVLAVEMQYTVDELFLAEKRVTPKQRSILVDWLVQVHQRFHLLPETLHLTVYLVDRSLERLTVDKTELQLVGISALLIASKYEETYCPELKDFEFITDNAFTKKQMLQMEQKVLKCSTFDLGRPHSIQFLRGLQKGDCEPAVHSLAKYFIEMALMDHSFSPLRPSLVAASSLWLATHLRSPKTSLARLFAALPIEDVMDEVKRISKLLAAVVLRVRIVGKLKAVTDKYNTTKAAHASTFSEADIRVLEKLAA